MKKTEQKNNHGSKKKSTKVVVLMKKSKVSSKRSFTRKASKSTGSKKSATKKLSVQSNIQRKRKDVSVKAKRKNQRGIQNVQVSTAQTDYGNSKKRKIIDENINQKSKKKRKHDIKAQQIKPALKQYPLRARKKKNETTTTHGSTKKLVPKTSVVITKKTPLTATSTKPRKLQSNKKGKKKGEPTNNRVESIPVFKSKRKQHSHSSKKKINTITTIRKRKITSKPLLIQSPFPVAPIPNPPAWPSFLQPTLMPLANTSNRKPTHSLLPTLPTANDFGGPIPDYLFKPVSDLPSLKVLKPDSSFVNFQPSKSPNPVTLRRGQSKTKGISQLPLFPPANTSGLKTTQMLLGPKLPTTHPLNTLPYSQGLMPPQPNPFNVPFTRFPSPVPLRRGRSKTKFEAQEGYSLGSNIPPNAVPQMNFTGSHFSSQGSAHVKPISNNFGNSLNTIPTHLGLMPPQPNPFNVPFSRFPSPVPLRRGRSKTKFEAQEGYSLGSNIPPNAVPQMNFTGSHFSSQGSAHVKLISNNFGSSLNTIPNDQGLMPPASKPLNFSSSMNTIPNLLGLMTLPLNSKPFNFPLNRFPNPVPLRRGRSKTKLDSLGSNIPPNAVPQINLTGPDFSLQGSAQVNSTSNNFTSSFNTIPDPPPNPFINFPVTRSPNPVPLRKEQSKSKLESEEEYSTSSSSSTSSQVLPELNLTEPDFRSQDSAQPGPSGPVIPIPVPSLGTIVGTTSSCLNISSKGLFSSNIAAATTVGPNTLCFPNLLGGVNPLTPMQSNLPSEMVEKIQKELSDESKKSFRELHRKVHFESYDLTEDDFQRFSLKELKAVLKLNDRSSSKTKKAIAKELCDYMKNGCPPRCPKCAGGRLRCRMVNGIENYICPGYFDDDEKTECDFKSMFMTRIPWINP